MALAAPRLEILSGKLAEEGYSPSGYGIAYWKEAKDYFSEAHNVCSQFLSVPGRYDYWDSFQMVFDHDCTMYPEVQQAWIDAGQEGNIQTIGLLPELKIWAVGFGGKKNAERACKLAMALSMAEFDPDLASHLSLQYPFFRTLLSKSGGIAASISSGGGAGAAAGTGGTLALPKLQIASGKLIEEGFSEFGYGMAYWKDYKDFFSEAHNILAAFLCIPGKYDYWESFQMIFDADASTYPEVQQAWIEAGQEGNVQTVGIIPELKLWAVGFGGKKNAERACKLAMALSMAEFDPETAAQLSAQNPKTFGLLLSCAGSEVPASVSASATAAASAGGGKKAKTKAASSGGGGGSWDDWNSWDKKGGNGGMGGGGNMNPMMMQQMMQMMMMGGMGGKGMGPYGMGGNMMGGKGGGIAPGIPASQKVWVGGLPMGTSNDELQAHFESIGEVKAVSCRGKTAIIAFSTDEDAQMAIGLLNGSEFNGSALQVDEWTGK